MKNKKVIWPLWSYEPALYKIILQNKIIFLPTYPFFLDSVTGNTPLFFFWPNGNTDDQESIRSQFDTCSLSWLKKMCLIKILIIVRSCFNVILLHLSFWINKEIIIISCARPRMCVYVYVIPIIMAPIKGIIMLDKQPTHKWTTASQEHKKFVHYLCS